MSVTAEETYATIVSTNKCNFDVTLVTVNLIFKAKLYYQNINGSQLFIK